MSSKKKRQINISKQKTDITENILRDATISSLNNFDKEQLLAFIFAIKKS